MTDTALTALYRAAQARLTAKEEAWGDRVYPDRAESGTQRPYVVFWWLGGGELNAVVRPDAGIVLGIKGVSETQVEAFALAARISALFNDADASSDPEADNAPLDGGSDWVIIHCNQEGIVHVVEEVSGQWIYNEGHRFRFRMEAT